jgi:hypothetical protein
VGVRQLARAAAPGKPSARRGAAARSRVVSPSGALLVLLTGLALAGCGDAKPGGGGSSAARKHASVSHAPAAQRGTGRSVAARIDVSSDRIVAEGKIRIAAGAPSDKEVRREIEAARKAGIKLPSGNSAQSFEQQQNEATGPAARAIVAEAPWNPRAKPIAGWIVPILEWAHAHGWPGTVTSGYRTFYEQAQINAAGAFSAPAGLSNHETTAYPGGAVDVTDPGQLLTVLASYPYVPKLVGGVLGPADPEHFSATGD